MKYTRLYLEKVLVRCEFRVNDVGKEQGISGEAKRKCSQREFFLSWIQMCFPL